MVVINGKKRATYISLKERYVITIPTSRNSIDVKKKKLMNPE